MDKREWDYVPSAVMFGKVTHDVIGNFNRFLMTDSKLSKQALVENFKQQFSVNIGDGNILYKDDDEPTQLLERGEELVALYYDEFHQLEPIEVEMEFRLPIIDTNTGDVASRDVVGKMDLLADGTVYDIKTAGKSMPQNAVNSNLQLLLYGWAYRVIYGESPKQLGIINLIKTKQPKIQVLITKLNGDKQEKLVRLMFNVILAIEKGIFYPNPLSTYGCDNCAYSMSCEFTL